MRTQNMTSARGNKVANQFIVHTVDGEYFQSYNTVIAFKPNNGGKIQLSEDSWDYSSTTGKYRNQFLNEGVAETRAKIANGTYVLADLKI